MPGISFRSRRMRRLCIGFKGDSSARTAAVIGVAMMLPEANPPRAPSAGYVDCGRDRRDERPEQTTAFVFANACTVAALN